MKFTTFLFFIFLFFTNIVFSQSILNSEKTFISQKGMQTDFNQWIDSLKNQHAGLYKYTDPLTFNHICDSIYNKLPDSLTIIDFYRQICFVNEKIKCGHTKIQLPDTNFYSAKIFIPLKIFYQENKAFVSTDLRSDTCCNLVKKQIIEIDNIDIKSIINKINDHNPSDGYNKTSKKLEIGNHFFYEFAKYINTNSTHLIKYLNQNDSVIIETIPSESLLKMIETRQKRYPKENENSDVLLKVDELNNYYHLMIPSFYIEPKQFKSSIDSIFTIIQEKKLTNLIIDVRNNGGGKIDNYTCLLSYLSRNKISTHYKRTYVKNKKICFYHTDNRIKPNKKHFDGYIYFIMNGITASAASEFMSIVQYYKLGKIFGEETGGANEGCCYGKEFIILKNSKIKCIIPYANDFFTKSKSPHGRGVMPDITINYTIDDIISQRDIELESILLEIKKNNH